MQCPACRATDSIFENYQEIRTTQVLSIGLEGYPVVSDDPDVLSSDVYSYNCSKCLASWDQWRELLADFAQAI